MFLATAVVIVVVHLRDLNFGIREKIFWVFFIKMNFVLTLSDINWLDYRDYIVIERGRSCRNNEEGAVLWALSVVLISVI